MKSPKAKTNKEKQFDFSGAISRILTGKSITKLEWSDKRYHALLKDAQLVLHKPDGNYYQWILSEADLRGDDYVEL